MLVANVNKMPILPIVNLRWLWSPTFCSFFLLFLIFSRLLFNWIFCYLPIKSTRIFQKVLSLWLFTMRYAYVCALRCKHPVNFFNHVVNRLFFSWLASNSIKNSLVNNGIKLAILECHLFHVHYQEIDWHNWLSFFEFFFLEFDCKWASIGAGNVFISIFIHLLTHHRWANTYN